MKSLPSRPWLPAGLETVFLLLCAAILARQLLLPGFIGMANNNDFAKIAGPLSIQGIDHEVDDFLFFQSDYVRGPQYHYDPHIPSSEHVLAWAASAIQQAVGDKSKFDIRWLGALHGLLFLALYFSILVLLRPLKTSGRILLSLAALWIFADVGLVAYLNSFYSDVPAILGGLAAVILAAQMTASGRPGLGLVAVFGLASLLFVTSKSQHGMLAIFPASLALAVAWRTHRWPVRVEAGVVAVALISAMIWMSAGNPPWYLPQSRFNLVFFGLLPLSSTPAQDLNELGLDPRDVRYIGMHTFMPASPMNDVAWRTDWEKHSSYARVAKFYLRHPTRALGKLQSDLWNEAWQRRAINLSNFRRADGQPAGARTQRLGSWGALRTAAFQWWPPHILVWYAAVVLLAPYLALRDESPFRRALLRMTLALTPAAIAEFCLASLADAAETSRHLLMFHLFSDTTFFFVLVFLASSLGLGGSPILRQPLQRDSH